MQMYFKFNLHQAVFLDKTELILQLTLKNN